MVGVSERSDLSDGEQERYRKIQNHNLPDAAIRRFLDDRDLNIPQGDDDFQRSVAQQLSDELVGELVQQYKYAGQQTLNYWILTGVSEYDLDEIVESAKQEFPERDDVEGIPNDPFLADTEIKNTKLYMVYGFFTSTGGVEPVTGTPKSELTTNRCVAVLHGGIDLLELRTSEPIIAKRIVEQIADALGGFKDSSRYQPAFDSGFQEVFNDLVEKYTNLKVRVEDRENTTVDTISFTSRESESGERKDARKDERVARELDERGGEITIGYVQLNQGFRFQINRKQAKISIMKHEREENINRITQIINDVLRETGGYTQSTLEEIENVPE